MTEQTTETTDQVQRDIDNRAIAALEDAAHEMRERAWKLEEQADGLLRDDEEFGRYAKSGKPVHQEEINRLHEQASTLHYKASVLEAAMDVYRQRHTAAATCSMSPILPMGMVAVAEPF